MMLKKERPRCLAPCEVHQRQLGKDLSWRPNGTNWKGRDTQLDSTESYNQRAQPDRYMVGLKVEPHVTISEKEGNGINQKPIQLNEKKKWRGEIFRGWWIGTRKEADLPI